MRPLAAFVCEPKPGAEAERLFNILASVGLTLFAGLMSVNSSQQGPSASCLAQYQPHNCSIVSQQAHLCNAPHARDQSSVWHYSPHAKEKPQSWLSLLVIMALLRFEALQQLMTCCCRD